MNLKEFDAKQFLLEKGERVGLGIAVTLMVLMLIVSLFLPSRGFFSGSPTKNAEALESGAASLEDKLTYLEPTEADKPGSTAGRLIALDTVSLKLEDYETKNWFEATRSDNPARRPPVILNIDEAFAMIAPIPIDTYIFNGRDFNRITILKTPDQKTAAGGGAGNSLSRYYGGRGGASAPSMATGSGGAQSRRQMGQLNRAASQVQGGEEKPEYETAMIPIANVDSNTLLARQLRPLRMALIAASFPYKSQLEEFKNKLRLTSVQDVLNETIDEGKEKQYAFRFLGVQAQRLEVDANGKKLGDWGDLDMAGSYKLWMLHSGLPFEPDDPKYDAIKPISVGLMMPRLRQFHEEAPPSFAMSGPMGGPMGGPRGAPPEAPAFRPSDSKYPDVEGRLKEVAATLDKLADVNPKQIAAPPSRFRTEGFDPFNPNNPVPAEEPPAAADKPDANAGAPTVPEYCLMRLVDVTIEPGKFYRYRVKVRMTNPNYGKSDVASPAYKVDKELISENWFELPQTLTTPPELISYVMDQKHASKDPKADKPIRGYPMYEIWNREPERDRQVAFQFHRWVESTPIVPDGDPVPVGEWSVADRVFVARGEYVGREVKVDLPVWNYTQNSFVLPAEDQKRKVRGKVPTGVTVTFGQESQDNETILVDFEGGRRHYEEPVPEGMKPIKADESSAFEVLMLTAEGKLLARNGAVDTNDEEREKRRDAVRQRIKDVRAGKSGNPNLGGGSGLDKR